MYSHLVISIDELWLKGKNRRYYLRSAIDHINAVFKLYHEDRFNYEVQSERLFYSSKTDFSQDLIDALSCVPGLAKISPCKMLKRLPDQLLDNMYAEIINELSVYSYKPFTFRALVKRNDKSFEQTSMQVASEIGHRVLENFPMARVDLHAADLVIDVRILTKHISISTQTKKGIGGLPWESTGTALTLLSGGFDSPVASYLMSKRGIKQSFVFFHAYPFVGREVLTKIKNLSSILAKFQRQTHLYIVPFGNVQQEISKHCREEYRTLIFRKCMIEIANMIAEKINAESLITGDCIGQVSSQTMRNLHLMDQSSKRMILRPLVGYNKIEILKLAELIGTHDISIIPHDDACSLFAPKNPVINPSMEYWKSFNESVDMTIELEKAVELTETYSINLKGELFKKDHFSYDL